MSTFNCCRGRAARIAACKTPAPPEAPVETSIPPSVCTPDGFFKRVSRFIKPLLPAFLLAIVPKCPFCLAAYVALGTGIGLSVTSARLLHISLLCAGLIPLSLFAAKHISNYFIPVPFSGWHQQVFTGMAGILIGSSILWLF